MVRGVCFSVVETKQAGDGQQGQERGSRGERGDQGAHYAATFASSLARLV